MESTIDARIERELDKLENSNLTDAEIERIQKKIKFLKSLEE